MKQGLIKGLAALALTAALAASAACAESISFTGQVTAKTTREVYAPIGGMVESVLVQEGERIGPDDVLATLTTTKVYAAEDGTVTGVFGQPGDATETVAERYGAVLYVEETAKWFDLLLGDDLQGRKDQIAQHGHEYLDLADIS